MGKFNTLILAFGMLLTKYSFVYFCMGQSMAVGYWKSNYTLNQEPDIAAMVANSIYLHCADCPPPETYIANTCIQEGTGCIGIPYKCSVLILQVCI